MSDDDEEDVGELVSAYAKEHEINGNEAWERLAMIGLRRVAALKKDHAKNGKSRVARKKKSRGVRYGASGYGRKPK